MKIFSLLAVIALCLAVSACGGRSAADVDSALTDARTLAVDGSLDDSLIECDDLIGDTAMMAAPQLGNLALTYMIIADHSNENGLVDKAVACYRQGLRTDCESIETYFNDQDASLTSYVMQLRYISRALDNPAIIPDDCVADTLAIDTIM